jgi:hypothetical protein
MFIENYKSWAGAAGVGWSKLRVDLFLESCENHSTPCFPFGPSAIHPLQPRW